MDQPMGYLILLAIAAVPAGLFGMFLLAIATGVIHEPTETESIAQKYGASWKSAHMLD